jgi:hypothetical protein
MPKIKYHVCLTEEERKELLNIVTRGTASARTIMHANVLLATDETHRSNKKINVTLFRYIIISGL